MLLPHVELMHKGQPAQPCQTAFCNLDKMWRRYVTLVNCSTDLFINQSRCCLFLLVHEGSHFSVKRDDF
jgi:hypothetical protein